MVGEPRYKRQEKHGKRAQQTHTLLGLALRRHMQSCNTAFSLSSSSRIVSYRMYISYVREPRRASNQSSKIQHVMSGNEGDNVKIEKTLIMAGDEEKKRSTLSLRPSSNCISPPRYLSHSNTLCKHEISYICKYTYIRLRYTPPICERCTRSRIGDVGAERCSCVRRRSNWPPCTKTICKMTSTFLYFAYGSNLLAKRIRLNNPSAVARDIGYIKVIEEKIRMYTLFTYPMRFDLYVHVGLQQ